MEPTCTSKITWPTTYLQRDIAAEQTALRAEEMLIQVGTKDTGSFSEEHQLELAKDKGQVFVVRFRGLGRELREDVPFPGFVGLYLPSSAKTALPV